MGAPSRTIPDLHAGAKVWLPSPYTCGAREMYCRNVYLRTGLTMPVSGWVIDLGANNGLVLVWAAITEAQVVAVKAPPGAPNGR